MTAWLRPAQPVADATDKRPRSATVTAVTDVVLAPISQGSFLVLVHDTPYFALEVMRSLSDRLRRANQMPASGL